MIIEDPNIVIRPATPEDFQNIKELSTLRFGEGYLDRDEFDDWLRYPTMFLVAEYEGNFAGYAFLKPEKPEKIADYMKLPVSHVRELADGKDVIHCRSAALSKEYEKKGLMYYLLSEELENAKELGLGAAFAPAWKYNGFVPMHKLMMKLGFTYDGDREMLWYDVKGYSCVICGGRCSCPAAIYERKL